MKCVSYILNGNIFIFNITFVLTCKHLVEFWQKKNKTNTVPLTPLGLT